MNRCPEAKETLKSNTYQANMHLMWALNVCKVEGGNSEQKAGHARGFLGFGIDGFISRKPVLLPLLSVHLL